MPRGDKDGGIDRRSFLRISGATGIAGASTMLAGCSGGGGGGGGTTAGGGGGGSDGGDGGQSTTRDPSNVEMGGTLRVALQADIDTLHPHKVPGTGIEMTENMSNGLLYADPDGELHPDLAREMPEVSDDGQTYTFQLREGVQFHPPYDREMTAEDVVANWRRILDSDYGAYGYGYYTGALTGEGPGGEQIDPETSVQATGEYEVTFNLAQTFAPFLIKQARMSSFSWFNIVPMEAVDEHGEDFGSFGTGAWATGPFMYNVEETSPGSEYVFDRNPNYFKEDEAGNQLPYADRVVFTIAPEASVRNTQLQAGQIDINDHVAATDVETIQNGDGTSVSSRPSTAQMSQWVNIVNFEPTANNQVRKAMMYAMNREAIKQTKFQGNAAIAHSVFPPFLWAYNEDACVLYDHDPDEAQSLLEEAGYGDGFSMSCEPTNQPLFVDVATILQQQYSQVGIDMSVSPVSKSATYAPIENATEDPPSDWHSLIENFTWAFAADDYTGSNFRCDIPFNYTHYCNPEADELMMEARRTIDRDQRQELYDEIQHILTDDLPKLFLLYTNNNIGLRDRVNNYRVWPTGFNWLEDVWVSQE